VCGARRRAGHAARSQMRGAAPSRAWRRVPGGGGQWR
jgi:hypothetical protein